MRSAILAPLLVALATPADAAQPIAGRWVTEDGSAIVAIGACGAGVCGRIATILKTEDGKSHPFDVKNPDAALRTRPIKGMVVLSRLADSGRDWRGFIYDPRSGKTYKSNLTRKADGTLKVQGCVAIFCRTQIWKPAQ